MRVTTVAAAILGLLVVDVAFGGTVWYVDDDAPPGGAGTTWASALIDLQDALAITMPGDEVRIGQGSYWPDRGVGYTAGDRDASFVLVADATIIGGFAGLGAPDPDERDPQAFVTILSGEIGAPGDRSDNTRHVVTCPENFGPDTVLDGVTITRGNTFEQGGGMIVWDFAAPMISQCVFLDNWADEYGGGLFSLGTPTIDSCRFIENGTFMQGGGAWLLVPSPVRGCLFQGNHTDDGQGGGLHAVGGVQAIEDCAFTANTATNGGGVSAEDGIRIERCTFTTNSTVLGGGALYPYDTTSETTVIGCAFIGNDARSGGAIQLPRSGPTNIINSSFLGNESGGDGGAVNAGGPMTFVNCRFSGNASIDNGGGAVAKGGQPAMFIACTFSRNSAAVESGGIEADADLTIAGCIFWGNDVGGTEDETAQIHARQSLAIDYSCVQGWTGGYGGTGNIGDNPVFANPTGPDGIAGTADDDLHIATGSPCVDAGDNTSVPPDTYDIDDDGDTSEPTPIDLDGADRFVDDPDTADTGQGTPPIVDMGAYEAAGSGTPAGRYTGPRGGSWLESSHWAGGVVPDADTDVFLDVPVVIDAPGAVARTVFVESGGILTVAATGTLVASEISVLAEGVLVINDATAHVSVETLAIDSDGALVWNAGTLRLRGMWTHPDAIDVGLKGSATLVVEAHARVEAPIVTVWPDGTAQVAGTVVAQLVNSGLLDIGGSPGIATVEGDYTQTVDGTLVVELEGYVPGSEYDQLVVSGHAALDGTCNVVLLPSFTGELAGDQRFLVAPTISGTFASEDIPDPTGPLVLQLTYDLYSEFYEAATLQLRTTLLATGPRLYVNQAAAPGGDAQSWATATDDLQAALEFGRHFPDDVDEVWVTGGTYTPDRHLGDRSRALFLPDGVQVYGGFAGGETMRSQRDIELNVTRLSGDLAGDDAPGFVNNDENSYTVVRIEGGADHGAVTVLDGVTITGGNANGPQSASPDQRGGGLYLPEGPAIIANCRFEDNHANQLGGGMLDSAEGTVVSNCAFVGNRSLVDGAGYVAGRSSVVLDCLFDQNQADSGGGAYATSGNDPRFERCMFTSNTGLGAGLRVEGTVGSTDVVLDDCQFAKNGASSIGGAILMSGAALLHATACSFSNNMPFGIDGVDITLVGCDFSGNTDEGALVCRGQVLVDDTTFTGNTGVFGGAMHIGENAVVDLLGCSFTQNIATRGGAIYIDVGAVATFEGGSATDNFASEGSGIFSREGRLQGHATLAGGDELLSEGILAPGRPGPPVVADVFTLDGRFRQRRSDRLVAPRLEINLGGPIPGDDFDVLNANDVRLEGGGLFIGLFGGFEPQIGQQFDVINAPSVTGLFDLAYMPGLTEGRYLDLFYGSGGVSAAVEELDQVIVFDPVEIDALGGTPTDAALVDADLDGDLDLVAVLDDPVDGPLIAVLRNAGTDQNGNWLGFAAPPTTTMLLSPPRTMAVGLFDGDDYPDLAVGGSAPDELSVFFNAADGSATFILQASYPEFGRPVRIAAGSTPGDRTVDLLVASLQEREVRHLMNDGGGSFALGTTFTSGSDPLSVRWIDINHDGFEDVAVLRDRPSERDFVGTYVYDSGSGSYDLAGYYTVDFLSDEMRVADLNDDGFPELITTARDLGTLTILLNSGDVAGTFVESFLPITAGDELRALAITDLELDGDRDLTIVVTSDLGEASARVIRNDQNGGEQFVLSTAIDVGTGGSPLFVLTGDVDGDSLPDLVAINAESPADGAGTIGTLLNSTQGACPADIDDSGAVDFADILAILSAWGNAGGPEDLNGSGTVDFGDLLVVLASWGLCQ